MKTNFLGEGEGAARIFKREGVGVLAIFDDAGGEVGKASIFKETEVEIEVFGRDA